MQLQPGEYCNFCKRQHFSIHLCSKSQRACFIQIFYFQFSRDQRTLCSESPLEYSLYSSWTSPHTRINAECLENVWFG